MLSQQKISPGRWFWVSAKAHGNRLQSETASVYWLCGDILRLTIGAPLVNEPHTQIFSKNRSKI
jgi:hypothetical protein